MKSADYIDPEELKHVLAALTAPNRLAMEISLATGLRIGDVLKLPSNSLRRGRRLTVREQKTGKSRRLTLPQDLWERALKISGNTWIFSGRLDENKSRTRQAVWKDLHRAAALFRCKPQISPHSARKTYAVAKYQKLGLKGVQALLGHSNEATTLLYALADQLTQRKRGTKNDRNRRKSTPK